MDHNIGCQEQGTKTTDVSSVEEQEVKGTLGKEKESDDMVCIVFMTIKPTRMYTKLPRLQ